MLTKELKKHFMKTPVEKYFPKLLEKPINVGTQLKPLFFNRRTHEWMTDIIEREMELLRIELPLEISIIEADPHRGIFRADERIENIQ